MSMNGEELELLAESCKRLHFNQGESIIKQNDPGDSLYVIADGVVSVQLDLKNGDRKTVSRLGVGDFFGEMSLMTGEPRTAHIITESPTVVINVEKDVIKKIFTNNAHFFDTVSAILAKRKVDLEHLQTSSEDEIKKVKNIAADLKKVIMNFLS